MSFESTSDAELRPREGLAGAMICVFLVVLFYHVVACVNSRPYEVGVAEGARHYEYLVDGFLSGRVSLSLAPAPELLALEDPRDPQQNHRYKLHDASLYKDHYYLYFGPTPAILLVPWRLVFASHLPQYFAAAIFGSIAYLFTVALLWQVRRRHFQQIGAFWFCAWILMAGMVNWVPVLLVRAEVWELPIACAMAFSCGALYCVARSIWSGGSAAWIVAASASYGLALGARPSIVFGAAALLVPLALPRLATAQRWRLLAAAVFPLGACLCAMGAYNWARFDDVFEFGQGYQLWADDLRGRTFFSLRYLPLNLWLYLLQPAGFLLQYPFVELCLIPAWKPVDHMGAEEMYGILPHMPVLVAAGGVLLMWGRDAGGVAREIKLIVCAALLLGVLGGCTLLIFGGVCSRYIAELVTAWPALLGVGWLALGSYTQNSSFRSKSLRAVLIVLGVWSIIFVVLATVGARNGRLAQFYPEFFATSSFHPSQAVVKAEV